MKKVQKQTKELYQYKESGLDYVWLANGFKYIDLPRGRRVQIKNLEGLHQAIGCFLVDGIKDFKGAEIRFLRHEMKISQSQLGRLLSVAEQSIRRWESDKVSINKSAEMLLRILYKAYISDDQRIRVREAISKMSSLETQISETDKKSISLNEKDSEWSKVIAA